MTGHPPMPPGTGPGRCDFCTVRPGTLDYPVAEAFQVAPGPPVVEVAAPFPGGLLAVVGRRRGVVVDEGDWSACQPCARALGPRDPARMADHVLAEWAAAGRPSPLDRDAMLALFGELLPRLGLPRAREAAP